MADAADPFADVPLDDPFADVPAVPQPGEFKTRADHWNGQMKERSIHAQNAARSASESADAENRPVIDDVAAGFLGAANSMDALGLADEARGAFAAGAAPWKALFKRGELPTNEEVINAYKTARDAQREATAQAEENSPLSSGLGQGLGLLPSAFGSFGAKVPQLGAQIVKETPSFLGVLGKGALGGAGFGAASGLGHGEGDAEAQLKSTASGALTGAAYGAAGAALPAFVGKFAPKASAMPVRQGLKAAPRELATNVGGTAARASRSATAAALDALAAGVGKAPIAGGAAVGGHLGGPVGAGVGGLVAQKALGPTADVLAGKLGSKATALRAKNAPPPAPSTAALLRGLLDEGFADPQLTSPSGLALDTATPKVNADLARLKRALAAESSVPVEPADILAAEDVSPWSTAYNDALEGRPVPSIPDDVAIRQAAVARLAEPELRAPGGFNLTAEQLRSGNLPPEVLARFKEIAEQAKRAEPSTTSDISGGAGFDELGSPIEESSNPSSWPLPDTGAHGSVAYNPEGLGKGAAIKAIPSPEPELPNTAAMPNPLLGRLRLESSRETPVSVWSDALDALERPAFDEFGNEQLNPAVREGWREAAARHAAPVEGGPTTTEGLSNAELVALLSRGSRTKGGLQGSSAYFPKRNAVLGEQAKNPALSPETQASAADLLANSRTAPPAEGTPAPAEFAASMRALPVQMQEAALQMAEQLSGPEYAAQVRAALGAMNASPMAATPRTEERATPSSHLRKLAAEALKPAEQAPPFSLTASPVEQELFSRQALQAKPSPSTADLDPLVNDPRQQSLLGSASPGFEEPLPSFVTKTADEMGLKGFEDERSATWKRREEGSGVKSVGEEQRTVRLARRHAREDALPKDRVALLREILASSGVGDSPTPKADAAFLRWKAGGRKGPRPTADVGGVLDAFTAAKEGKAPSSLVEAWEKETRNAKTYRDLLKSGALDALAEALGVDVRLPDEVIQRHLTQDLEAE